MQGTPEMPETQRRGIDRALKKETNTSIVRGEQQMNVEARLTRLESIETIRNLKAEYCDLCDSGYDADAITALFTEDGAWDGGPLGCFEGRTRLHRFFSNMPKSMSFAAHHITNSAVKLADDGESAKARWYLLQTATLASEPRAVWLAAVYDDVLVRTAGEWKFQRMTIRTRFFTPHDEGWVKTPQLGATR